MPPRCWEVSELSLHGNIATKHSSKPHTPKPTGTDTPLHYLNSKLQDIHPLRSPIETTVQIFQRHQVPAPHQLAVFLLAGSASAGWSRRCHGEDQVAEGHDPDNSREPCRCAFVVLHGPPCAVPVELACHTPNLGKPTVQSLSGPSPGSPATKRDAPEPVQGRYYRLSHRASFAVVHRHPDTRLGPRLVHD